MKYPWLRLYSEMPQDAKLKRVARLSGLNRCLVVGFWTSLLCLASESPERGVLLVSDDMPMEIEDMAEYAGISKAEAEKMLKAFIELGMLECHASLYSLPNWEERNPESDLSTERVIKHRKKLLNQSGSDETFQNRFSNGNETFQKQDETVSATEGNSFSNGNETLQIKNKNKESDKESEREEEKRAESDSSLRAEKISEPEPVDDFEKMQRLVETTIGLPLAGEEAIKAIKALLELDAQEVDLQAAAAWMRDNSRVIRYAGQLVGPVRTAVAKRKQAANAATASPAPPGSGFKTSRVDQNLAVLAEYKKAHEKEHQNDYPA